MKNEKLLFSKSFQTFYLVISLLQKYGYVKKKGMVIKKKKGWLWGPQPWQTGWLSVRE